MVFALPKGSGSRRRGRHVRTFCPGFDSLPNRQLLSTVPLADGSLAYVNSAQQLYVSKGGQQIFETGGVVSMDSLPGGKAAVLLSNDQLRTFDGTNWAVLSGGVTQLGANANGTTTVTLQDGVQCTYDGQSFTPLTPGISTILPLPSPGGSLAILHGNGQLESFNGQNWTIQTAGVTSMAPLANGSVAVFLNNGQLQTFDGQHWALQTGGVTSMAPLANGSVAVFLNNGQLQTFDGQHWGLLASNVAQIGACSASSDLEVVSSSLEDDGEPVLVPGGSQQNYNASITFKSSDSKQFCGSLTLFGWSAQLCQGGQNYSISIGVGKIGSVTFDTSGDITLGFSGTMITGFGVSTQAYTSLFKPEFTICSGVGAGWDVSGTPFGVSGVEYTCNTITISPPTPTTTTTPTPTPTTTTTNLQKPSQRS
jgi:hypothetical protein